MGLSTCNSEKKKSIMFLYMISSEDLSSPFQNSEQTNTSTRSQNELPTNTVDGGHAL